MSFSSMLMTSATPWAGYTALSPTLNSTSWFDCMTSPFAITDFAGCGPQGFGREVRLPQVESVGFRPVLVPETRLERIGQEFHSEGSRRSRNLVEEGFARLCHAASRS